MKIRIKKHTPDYREAQMWLASMKEKGTTYLTYDYTTKSYTLEADIIVENEADMMRAFLLSIKENLEDQLAQEELDALAYADSAIKTLSDMGVLK